MGDAHTPTEFSGPDVLARPPGSVISGRCPMARFRHVLIGVILYGPIAALVSARLVFDGADTGNRWGTMLLVMGLLLLVVVVAGASIDVRADGDGLRVRNRWRRATVRWSDIERIELRRSPAYWVFDVWVGWQLFFDSTYSAVGPLLSQSRWLVVRRHGRRRRLPVGATLGIMALADDVQPFITELERRGFVIEGLQASEE